jgi:flagellar biosynthesis/type III secretory pathway M-ring protein FliF/YscJ
MEAARYAGYVLVTFLILWFVGRPLMRYLTEPHSGTVRESPYLEAAGIEGEGGTATLPERDEERRELEQRRQEIEERSATENERQEQVREVVRNEQENAVGVIRQWLRE